MQGVRIYISENGYLNIPEYNIKYLIDPTESSIPNMPEAVEASVRVAGKDGDISLKTTYEPMSFNIVCYTEDNLNPNEKTEQEYFINMFLDSIKNNTTKFGIEQEAKFYNVKYNGALVAIKYPKHIKFSIPLKASFPYAMSSTKRKVVGTTLGANFESSTIKEVGGVFIINGPATNPKIALNNYQMEYDFTILEGNKLIIDSGNSTAILENSLGVKTNAMRYYNHQFPKIQRGQNEFIILSGINDNRQVSLEWYDLKL